MYINSRRRLGVTSERMALVENGFGATAVTTLEAADISQVVNRMISSDYPFDRWYRERMLDLHGIQLAGYQDFLQPAPPAQNQELLFEWTFISGDGGF